MKFIFSFLIVLNVSYSLAAGLQYKCFSLDDNEPYGLDRVEVSVVNKSTLKIKLEVLKTVIETYKLNSRYVGTAESMKNFLQFNITNSTYGAYGEGPVTPFFVESQLFTGGYPLRRGGTGAIIKTTGHGYSWARYLCVLQ